MKPWYLKKKLWTAVITAIAAGIANYTGDNKLAELVTFIGISLIGALGAEDLGKSKEALSSQLAGGRGGMGGQGGPGGEGQRGQGGTGGIGGVGGPGGTAEGIVKS